MTISSRFPKVTVMMPALNVEKYIAGSVESVLRQDWKDFELIILDDCSEDGTLQVAQKYTEDQRVRLFSNKIRQGDAANRNFILQQARGKYIAPHDADDIMLQGRLKKQVAFLESKPSVGVVFGNAIVADTALKKAYFFIRPVDKKNRFLYRSARVDRLPSNFSHCASLARKTLIVRAGGYEDSLVVGTDARLYRRILNKGNFYYLNHLCFIYRKRRGSFFSTYVRTRSLGMRRLFYGKKNKETRRDKYIYLDRFCLNEAKLPEALRDTLRWRLNYYWERMNWLKKRQRSAPLNLLNKAALPWAKLDDQERYEKGFLLPLAAKLAPKKELLMQGALVSYRNSGILLLGPQNECNGSWVLPFLQEDYFFYTASAAILSQSEGRIMVRGLLDPLVFPGPLRRPDGVKDGRLFWNPMVKKHCLNVDIYKTYALGERCELKAVVKIIMDANAKKPIMKRLSASGVINLLTQNICARDTISTALKRTIERAPRGAFGIVIRLAPNDLRHLPALTRRANNTYL